ncbi:MAG: hypothetical protein M3271_02790, partial [Actinomycetota bacterium]|nr:hypothetical protein [Actinomycetota bacterium]
TGAAVEEERVRRWLTNLRRTERLDDPVMRALLRVHGRDATGAGLEVGRRAIDLLAEKIDALRPSEAATAAEHIPHRVLEACFVRGAKSFQAAAKLGLSERQLSRERSRAITLLAAELSSVARAGAGPSAAPPFEGLVPRADLAERLESLLEGSRRVHVTGASGAGKTSLLAAYAATAGCPVFWFTVIPRVNADLWSVLFDLGEHLAPEDASLATYMHEALPSPNAGLATRLALASLSRSERLLVLDDLDAGAADRTVEGFLAEITTRLRLPRIVTTATSLLRYGSGVPSLPVPPFNAPETAELLRLRGVGHDAALARELHARTHGNPRLLDLAIRWLAASAGADTAAVAAGVKEAVRTDPVLLSRCARAIVRGPGRAA